METKEVEEKKEKINKNQLTLPSAIVVAGVLISLALIFSSSGNAEVKSAPTEEGNPPIEEVTDADFIKGSSKAEVTVIEYSDFSCSFCARYHPTMKRLVEEYDGKVKWVYRHLPIFNKPAAVASSCVGNILGDESFFLYADKLFANQKDINGELLKREALALGVNEIEYDSCINDKELNDKITREFTTVRVLAGFNATPHTVIVDKSGKMYPFSGALPYEEVSALIDSVIE
jgi:protein-disulfide isomerase